MKGYKIRNTNFDIVWCADDAVLTKIIYRAERETERGRERQRETERDRERQRATKRDRERQRVTERGRERRRD